MGQQDSKSNDQYLNSHHYSGWEIVKLYWQSEFKRNAYLVFTVIVAMTVVLVVFDVIFSYWFNYFYDALQAYKARSAVILLIIFFVLAFINIIIAVYRYYISQTFGLRWRKWLTEQFIGRWLRNRDYYYLENFDEYTDNPDQRIQEDIASLVSISIGLFTGLIASVTTFIGFFYVLWQLSGVMHIHLWGNTVLKIQGYLVWVAVVYALIGTYFTFKLGYPLVHLNYEQQRREATFRFAAIDLRSHAEHVALYRGEDHQKGILHRLFGNVLDNYYLIIVRQKLLLWFTSGYNQTAVALPLLVALPNYFEKIFKLGGLMQSLRAFSSIQDALSFLVNSYTTIAEFRAVTRRLTNFLNHMQDIDAKIAVAGDIKRVEQSTNHITTRNLSIDMPDGSLLLDKLNLDLKHGNHYLIKGPSGLGKSTFVRTIAGIWPFASGEVLLPANKNIMYLPQKPYMPIGTLAEAMLFPDHHTSENMKMLEQFLRDVRLEHLIPELNKTASWGEQLSPGEQQRIAFARVLLQKPDWVFLDESTSMLDLANEEYLYRLLQKQLPNCSIVSVGHRPSLDVHHNETIDMTDYRALAHA